MEISDRMHKLEPEDYFRLGDLKPTERPMIRPISVDHRLYEVESRRSGECYEVSLSVIKGDWYFHCTCTAASFDKKCYHGPAAALANIASRHARRVALGLETPKAA